MMGGIRDLLETLFESVIMVSDETALLNAASKLHPDLVVMYLSFPVSGEPAWRPFSDDTLPE